MHNYNQQEPLPAQQPSDDGSTNMPLLRNNFIVMAIAGVMIILGFVLMAGAPSNVDAYNPDIFSGRRIVVGPLLSFIGFIVMAVAIIIKPKK